MFENIVYIIIDFLKLDLYTISRINFIDRDYCNNIDIIIIL